MTPHPLLWKAAMWAGLISVDITGCGPWMISQPVAAGPLFAWVLGQIQIGVVIGGIVQLVWMDVSPVGVGIPVDTTAITLLAVYWASLKPDCPVSTMMLMLLAAVPFGYAFAYMDTLARRVNTMAVRRLEKVPDAYLATAINLGIFCGLLWAWLRYAAFYALIMFGGEVFWKWAERYPIPDWINQGLQVSAYLLPIAGLGVVLELFLTDDPEGRYPSFKGFKSRS